jgi:23S rRNA (cytosine1962-C5)-methyltransferase
VDLFDTANRRILTLKQGKERLIANRHPWIFAGAIARESGPEDAAIADLHDPRGRRIASGFHSRHSQIRLRALTFGEEVLTEGTIVSRISTAISRRQSNRESLSPRLLAGRGRHEAKRSAGEGRSLVPQSSQAPSPSSAFGTFSPAEKRGGEGLSMEDAVYEVTTNAARLVNAEGDDLSGIVIDRYDDILVIEIANAGIEQLRPLIIDVLQSELKPRGIWFKNDIPPRKIEELSMQPEWMGEGEPSTEIRENGLRFRVDPPSGQKTGFFLDQRENRQLTRALAQGRRVLNLFSYSGGFGVYASAGGAASVENVDISAPAIEMARTNHTLNGFDASFVVADAFDYVRKTESRFDLAICDPPAFAKSRGDVDRAARGYKDINLFAMKLLDPAAHMLTFSCSGHMPLDLFQKVIFAAAQDAGRRVSFLRRLTAAPDHPVSLFCPEGEYLKGFLLEIR